LDRPERDIIGILTGDVRLYYDLARFLRSRNMRFRLLDFKGQVPPDIGVIMTSPDELERIGFEPKVAVTDIEAGMRQALQAMKGMGESQVLIVGVDPGPEPGIAALSGGDIIETRVARSPQQTADIIRGILSDYSYSRSILKIGNGSPEHRDRILELVSGSFDLVEVVDETCTSNQNRGYHVEAAIRIARFGDGR